MSAYTTSAHGLQCGQYHIASTSHLDSIHAVDPHAPQCRTADGSINANGSIQLGTESLGSLLQVHAPAFLEHGFL
jgi:hypothetical protein